MCTSCYNSRCGSFVQPSAKWSETEGNKQYKYMPQGGSQNIIYQSLVQGASSGECTESETDLIYCPYKKHQEHEERIPSHITGKAIRQVHADENEGDLLRDINFFWRMMFILIRPFTLISRIKNQRQHNPEVVNIPRSLGQQIRINVISLLKSLTKVAKSRQNTQRRLHSKTPPRKR